MIWTGAGDLVDRGTEISLGNEFLEPGLVVLHAGAFRSGRDVVDQQVEYKTSSSIPTGFYEDSPDKGLQGISQNRLFLTATRLILAFPEQKTITQTDPIAHLGQHHGIHNRRPQFRQLSLWELGVTVVDVICDSQPQHGVAQELEPFVWLDTVGFGAVAPMCERESEQRRVDKLVSEPIAQFSCIDRAVQESAPTCPCT